MSMVAALFVQRDGCYAGLPGVDAWDEARDARLYPGPHPVVAHPPCARWGRFWGGSPTTWPRLKLGDDDGCFAAALASVRAWGGVLEHPKDSLAWAAHGIVAPPHTGGWIVADIEQGGWTCCVDQGHYGHPARKPTWLYAYGVDVFPLRWGPSPSVQHATSPRRGITETLSKKARAATPPAFRDELLRLARRTVEEAAA